MADEDTKESLQDTKQEVKPEVDAQQINLKVKDGGGNEVQFRIKRSTQLKKLMDAYCNRMGAEPNTYRFIFDGNRVGEADTPDKLEMEEGDVIDALVYQQGGSH
eukprot:Plantae.Rhodophyta-Purpureofilum_apyrenoidigerum.ctg12493.p1 GENE.Plantae.Rhodophyta-Purpureofilum_apyrenoidigerum.ctg12493~~Plantae.Rhodophyta-Purpureofilum_apyrenoidigerum.ctg12493.p1  ORF type:complete len:104 (-),score=29.72 Plantae.Rhodophyta-Purpureofilum_apyrenoidigerum.ctg12493:163-474(-)